MSTSSPSSRVNALILAAGYGTRLGRDIEADESGKFSHLKGVPKPLLPIGGVPLISRWMNQLAKCEVVGDVYVVTNTLNHSMFEAWAAEYPNVKLCREGSTSNSDRSGAVACVWLAVDHFKCQDDLLVIGGDTLFFEDFDLDTVVTSFQSAHRPGDGSMLLSYKTDDVGASKCGILEVDEDSKVTAFLEKPGPEATKSRLACPCFYMFSPAALTQLPVFLEDKKDQPLKARDAPGNFVRYLSERLPCFTTIISGRFDVGGLASYIECDAFFAETEK